MKAILTAAIAVAFAMPAHSWTIADMNKHIDQTNFIVGKHCSATLISAKERILLTNAHCVDQYFKVKSETKIDDENVVSEVKVSTVRDVPVTQKIYDGYDVTGEMTWTTKVEARSVGDDLALLKFRAASIPQVAETRIFDGIGLHRGQTVYAVGNALGHLDATVTKGIISSINRTMSVGDVVNGFFIQMDAGIIGGNSGGSLYNDSGELIGVPSAAYMGTHLGFSIPYTTIRAFLSKNGYGHLVDPPARNPHG